MEIFLIAGSTRSTQWVRTPQFRFKSKKIDQSQRFWAEFLHISGPQNHPDILNWVLLLAGGVILMVGIP